MLLGVDPRAEEERPADQEGAERVGMRKFSWGHEEIVAGMVWVTSLWRRKDLTQRAQRRRHRDHGEESEEINAETQRDPLEARHRRGSEALEESNWGRTIRPLDKREALAVWKGKSGGRAPRTPGKPFSSGCV